VIKQVIVIRKDLKMRRGKEIAQGAHASMAFLTNRLGRTIQANQIFYEGVFSNAEASWIKGSFAKICVRVESEEELLAIHRKAKDAGLVSELIQDSGATEFHGIPTYTCLAIGPDESERIDKVTGSLRLY
jgi:PTH2 family peptidyl-tRNA hydrolase